MRPISLFEKLQFCLIGPAMARDFYNAFYKDRKDIEALQNQRFLKLVRHAFETVPFYQQKYKQAGVRIESIKSVADIKELPVLEKSELLAAQPDQLLSTKYRDLKKIFMLASGGTSGNVLKVYHSRQSIYASLASYHRSYANMMGGVYARTDVGAYVYTCPYPFQSFFGAYPQHYIWTLDPIEVIRAKLLSAQPHLLTVYPSILERLTKELSKQDRQLIARRLKAISVNSEMSSQSQRDYMSEEWGVPVLDEFCSEEISTMMFHQCPHKNYHTHHDLSVIESVGDDGMPLPCGVEGSLIATSLWNYAMPMIRYNQQDRIILSDKSETCSCGIKFPLVESFEGRTNDAFILRSGKVLSSGFMLDVGYSIFAHYTDYIRYWSLIQESVDKIVLECVLVPGVTAETIRGIEEELGAVFKGEAATSLRIVEKLPTSLKGKRKQVISKVAHREIDHPSAAVGTPP